MRGTGVSDTDSFIEEVTEEVRRDRLFALIRRYGWIAIVAGLLLVGGAAYNEWRKAQDIATAQALGDSIVAALEQDDAPERATALDGIGETGTSAEVVVALLRAAELADAGQTPEAVAQLDAIALNGDVPEIYRQIAGFKSILLQGDSLEPAERRLRLESVVQTGSPLRLLAEEQLALLDSAEGKPEAAISRLERIIADSEVTAGLRRRGA